MKLQLAVLPVLALAILGPQAAATTKTNFVLISVRAKDATGALIANGVVSLIESDATAKTYTGRDGRFTFLSVSPRIYELVIEAPRFRDSA
jgi:hypothetical protein